jgi:hypothetical protein
MTSLSLNAVAVAAFASVPVRLAGLGVLGPVVLPAARLVFPHIASCRRFFCHYCCHCC